MGPAARQLRTALIAAVVAASLLAGCGDDEASKATTTGAASGPIGAAGPAGGDAAAAVRERRPTACDEVPPSPVVYEGDRQPGASERPHGVFETVPEFSKRHPGAVGGVFINRAGPGSHKAVVLTRDYEQLAGELAGMVSDPERLQVIGARYSRGELNDVEDRVADEYLGSKVLELGVNVSKNVVEVGLDDYTGAAAREVRAELGPAACATIGERATAY